jgi:Flp pilus assembly protein TadD
MVILALILTAPAGAKQKPLTQEEVQGLVQGGMGNETGARVIAPRGLDFCPTEDFLRSLKSAGANEAFLQALRTAKRPWATGGEESTPLTQAQVLTLVAGEVPNPRVIMLVQERGIDFDPTPQFLHDLRLAGGNDEIVETLQVAQVIKPQRTEPSQVVRQAEIRQPTVRAVQPANNPQYAQTESAYRAATRMDPQNADLHVSLGMALGRKGDWDGQITEDREALRLNPNNESAHLNLGMALMRKNDQDGAIAEFREAVRLNPGDDRAHNLLGGQLTRQRDWAGAIAEFTEAVRLNPNNASAHFSLGTAYEHQGNRQAALQEYRTAYELRPQVALYQRAYERMSSPGSR